MKLLSRKEAAAYLRVCPRTLDRYLDAGLLTRRRVGPKTIRVAEDDLRALVAVPR
jgi:excisionase family DNA binding protein